MDPVIRINQPLENLLNQLNPQRVIENKKIQSVHIEVTKIKEGSNDDNQTSQINKNPEEQNDETEEILPKQNQDVYKIDEKVVNMLSDFISDRSQKVCVKFSHYITDERLGFQLLYQNLSVLMKKDQKIRSIFFQDLHDIFESILYYKLPGVVDRVILKYIDKLDSKTELDLKKYQKERIHSLWNKIDEQSIPDFIRIFNLQTFIPDEQLHIHLVKLVESKRVSDAMNLFEVLKSTDRQIYRVIDSSYKHNPSAAADVVKQCKFPFSDFKEIDLMMKQSYIRYMVKNQNWYNCEENMAGLPDGYLVNLVQILYRQKQKDEALSIVVRHKLQDKIEDQSMRKKIEEHLKLDNFQFLDNILQTLDDFEVPTNWIVNKNEKKEDYLTILELGVTEQQTFFISDDQSELYKDVDHKLRNSLITGIDSEFIQSTSKFDLSGTVLKIVQISNGQENYIFDLVTLKKSVLFKELMKHYLETISILKLGLSVLGDIQLLCSTLELKKITVQNVIDVGQVYQTLYSEQNQKGLAFLTEFYLKKKLSKLDQCSNWSNRPLRRAQLHYAALDALVCVRIYEKQLLDDNIDKAMKKDKKNYKI